MKPKLEPRLIDVSYIDRELDKLFNSVYRGQADDQFIKYRNRFMKHKRESINPDYVQTSNSTLSLARKLLILCTYGDYKIVKMDKSTGIGQCDIDKSDKKTTKMEMQDI